MVRVKGSIGLQKLQGFEALRAESSEASQERAAP